MTALARRIVTVLILAVVIVAVPSVAQARFARSTGASLAVATDVLSAPTGASAAKQCSLLSPYASVSWTATPDTYATGYTVTMAKSSGATSTITVNGRGTTSVTVQIGFLSPTTFTVAATYRSWSSASTAPTAAVQCGYLG